MINFEYRLLKVLKFFKKTNANNKRSITIFVNKVLHLKPVNNKKQVVEKNTDEFKYEGDTNETKDADGDGGFNDNSDDDDGDDNDDDGDVEIEDNDDNDDKDDDGGDSIGDEGNFVDGVTANWDVSNIKHLIGETR